MSATKENALLQVGRPLTSKYLAFRTGPPQGSRTVHVTERILCSCHGPRRPRILMSRHRTTGPAAVVRGTSESRNKPKAPAVNFWARGRKPREATSVLRLPARPESRTPPRPQHPEKCCPRAEQTPRTACTQPALAAEFLGPGRQGVQSRGLPLRRQESGMTPNCAPTSLIWITARSNLENC